MSSRLVRLRSMLVEQRIDGILVVHPANRYYLSGYTGEDHPPEESAGVLLITRERALLFASPNNVDWAQSEAHEFEIIGWQRPWERTVADQLKSLGLQRIGFEDRATIQATVSALSESLDGGVALLPIGNAVTDLRSVKDAEELSAIERAIRLTDDVFIDVVDELEAGLTERDVAWRIERAFRDRGADGAAFPTIVASGPHAARPHHRTSERAIATGEPVVIDMGARLNGYNADLTRTVWVGATDDRLRAVYNVVLDAQATALAAIQAGITGADADKAARAVMEAAGFGDNIVHSLGHGLGIQVHEAPSASPAADRPLMAGEVLTVEPGLYFPSWGGVRIEDVVVIEEGGCRNLTTAPKHHLIALQAEAHR